MQYNYSSIGYYTSVASTTIGLPLDLASRYDDNQKLIFGSTTTDHNWFFSSLTQAQVNTYLQLNHIFENMRF